MEKQRGNDKWPWVTLFPKLAVSWQARPDFTPHPLEYRKTIGNRGSEDAALLIKAGPSSPVDKHPDNELSKLSLEIKILLNGEHDITAGDRVGSWTSHFWRLSAHPWGTSTVACVLCCTWNQKESILGSWSHWFCSKATWTRIQRADKVHRG